MDKTDVFHNMNVAVRLECHSINLSRISVFSRTAAFDSVFFRLNFNREHNNRFSIELQVISLSYLSRDFLF